MPRRSEAETSLVRLPCACANLRRAARAVTQLYTHEMQRGGLGPTPLSLLWTLAQHGKSTQKKLGERLALDSTTLTRTLAPLIRKGWIEAGAGHDRRERHLKVTAEGRRQIERARPHWERAQNRLRRVLGDSDWNHLQAALLQVERVRPNPHGGQRPTWIITAPLRIS